jgi:hypothetical protein
VTTKVLNVLTDGRTNKGIIDKGVIVDSGAVVTLTNLEAVDPRRIVEDSTKQVEPPVIIQEVANGFPMFFKSKATSVAMAHPKMIKGHADVSRGACEIYGAAQATFNILFLRYCADEMGVQFNMPANLEMDNSAAEVFANDTAMNTKLRHIDQRQHWVQALRNTGLIKARHGDTELNLADIFTKALQGKAFRSQPTAFILTRLHVRTYVCIHGKIDIIEINHDHKFGV